MHNINKQVKTHMTVSTDTEKALNNTQYPLIKTLKKLGIESNILNMIKGTCAKPIPNFKLTS